MKKLIATILLSMIPSFAFAGEVITTGQGATLEAAIHNAMRAAIEQEIGALVESETQVKDRQTIIDNIMINSSGLIEGYEVMTGWGYDRTNAGIGHVLWGLREKLEKAYGISFNCQDWDMMNRWERERKRNGYEVIRVL